jgi:large subunit ribosomal protein L23
MSNKNPKSLSLEEASQIILRPYITEKTYNLIDKENKVTFIVNEKATKTQILASLRVMYEAEGSEVNTVRTISGKKAFVKFVRDQGARDLATRLGLV